MEDDANRKPNLFIAGAAKAGTTSLFNYLRQHPDIFPCSRKEPRYFTSPDFLQKPIKPGFRKYIVSDFDEYMKLFAGASDERYLMEASVFIMFFKDAMLRIKQFNPDSKIIIVLRNPMERIYSHYKMFVNHGEEIRTFSSFLKNPVLNEGISILEAGLYSSQVCNAFEIFGRENVLVLKFDDFKNDLKGMLDSVYDFLGVGKIYPENMGFEYLKSPGLAPNKILGFFFLRFRPVRKFAGMIKGTFFEDIKDKIKGSWYSRYMEKGMTPREKSFLRDYYFEDICRTEEITGMDLGEWKKS